MLQRCVFLWAQALASFYVTGALSDGLHQLSAKVGNGTVWSAASEPWFIVVADAIPAPGQTITITHLIDDTPINHMTAQIGKGGVTADTTPTVVGTVSSVLMDDESVVIYRDNVRLGNATMDATEWSYCDSGVALGDHTYTARVETVRGHGPTSDGFNFTESAFVNGLSGSLFVSRGGASFDDHDGYLCTLGGTFPTLNGQSPLVSLHSFYPGGGYLGTALNKAPPSDAGGWFNNGSTDPSRYFVWTFFPDGPDGPEYVFDSHTITQLMEFSDSHPWNGAALPFSTSDLPPMIHESMSSPLLSMTHEAGADQVHVGSLVDTEPLVFSGRTKEAKDLDAEVIDLGGKHNALKLSLVDVLNLDEADLFRHDGKQQVTVKGKEGDVVVLSSSLAEGEWEQHGTAQVGGAVYNVYGNPGVQTELLVQQGVQIAMQ